MLVDTAWLPEEADTGVMAGMAVVVIDVLRASTTMVHALGNGAVEIIPVAGEEDARETARDARRPARDARRPARDARRPARDARHPAREACPSTGVLLCGERGGKKLLGFDLGNSPLEYTAERVSGKRIVLTTTNATRALAMVSGGDLVLVAALSNAGAVAASLMRCGRDIVLLCCGTEGEFALEDAVCAGAIAERIAGDGVSGETDATRVARSLFRGASGDLEAALRNSRWGRHLAGMGLDDDIVFSSRLDSSSVVPRLVPGGFIRP